MKFVIIISAFLAFSVAAELYSTENDHLDIEAVVSDPTTLKAFLDCFNDKGSCNEEMADFKILPEIVKTACSKCSPMQKRFAGRTFQAFRRYSPEKHEELKYKLDPKNTYFANFESVVSMS